ncbi:MAG: 26S protease regulatory subunit [Anaerolineaceae bacterium]
MPVDLSASIYQQYLRVSRLAVEAERGGRTKEAAHAYRQAAEFMRSYAKYALDPSVKKKREQKAASLEQAAEALIKLPEGSIPAGSQPVNAAARKQTAGPKGEEEPGDEFEAQIKQLITTSKTTWDDVAGMADTKAAIKTAYFEALAQKPPMVEISGARGILLYGPPGTGKTLLAAATAGSLDATFFSAKASDMLSKWFGESTQKVSALFRVARQMNPAVIFMDEIEALALTRSENASSANLQVVSTMLAELDGMDFKDRDQFVLSIGATNVPWMLDTGILRRFPKRIYVPLPDLDLRRAIFEIHLAKKGHQAAVPVSVLAERTEGYSGDEIRQLCSTAIDAMIHRMNPDSLAIVDRGREAVREYTLKVDTIQESEFESAFAKVRPITNPAMIQRFENWANNVKD